MNDEVSAVVHQSEDTIHSDVATIEVRLLVAVARLRVFADVRASVGVSAGRCK